jgi:hypothetical protein
MMIQTCHPIYTRGIGRRTEVQAGLGKKHKILSEKSTENKGNGGVAQVKSACQANVRPWVQYSALQKQTNKNSLCRQAPVAPAYNPKYLGS